MPKFSPVESSPPAHGTDYGVYQRCVAQQEPWRGHTGPRQLSTAALCKGCIEEHEGRKMEKTPGWLATRSAQMLTADATVAHEQHAKPESGSVNRGLILDMLHNLVNRHQHNIQVSAQRAHHDSTSFITCTYMSQWTSIKNMVAK